MIRIVKAEAADLRDILALQYLAYRSEAQLVNDFSIPPLKQTLDELEEEFGRGIILKALDEEGGIIGSVRGYSDGNTLFIGKLIVHPDMQGQGIGTRLLGEIEDAFPGLRCELFTGHKSEKNLKLYERLGYTRFREDALSPSLKFIYLEKYR